MRREHALILILLTLVIGPTVLLTVVTSHALLDWQESVEAQLRDSAGSALLDLPARLDDALTEAREAAARACRPALDPRLRPDALLRAGRAAREASGLIGQVVVLDPDGSWVFPFDAARGDPGRLPPPAPGAAADGCAEAWPSAEALQFRETNAAAAHALYAECLARPGLGTEAACEARLRLAQCLRRLGRDAEAAAALEAIANLAPAPDTGDEPDRFPLDPDGYAYGLLARAGLTALREEAGDMEAALDNEIALVAGTLAAYPWLPPPQRVFATARARETLPRLLAAAGGSAGLDAFQRFMDTVTRLQEDLDELARDGPDGKERRAVSALVRTLAARDSAPARRGEWVVTDHGAYLLGLLPGPRPLFVGYRADPEGVRRHLDLLVRRQSLPDGVEVRVEGWGGAADGPAPEMPPTARTRLYAPFGRVAVSAHVRAPRALRAAASLRTRLYGWTVLLLASAAGAGAWLLWGVAMAEIRRAHARGEFLAGVSHDLRTPLSSLRVLAETLQLDHVREPARRDEFLGAMLRECDRLERMTARALYFLRFGQNALSYRRVEGDLGALVREATDAFRHGLPKGAGPVRCAVEGNLPRVRYDADALSQVLANLLDNAAKYAPSPQGIDVAVRAARGGRAVAIEIRDFGPGIPARERRKILRRFYRGRASGAVHGSGLGLTLCRHVVRGHRGRIEVGAPEDGPGSRFRVILPADG